MVTIKTQNISKAEVPVTFQVAKQDDFLIVLAAAGALLDGYSGVLSESPTKSFLLYDVPPFRYPPQFSLLSNIKSLLPSYIICLASIIVLIT